ncbi:hypothetical protein HW555_011991 [Spodoptera exigua]|uniref:Uncharacterized protein n=1 Tax=Spodoptera exigua TaxID=7107 RepID=A0A835KZH0_SPOEX|nr:hypothetical protein HW555_011991 [Spodoptera exigua]
MIPYNAAIYGLPVSSNSFIGTYIPCRAPVVEHRRRRGCKCMRPPCSSSSNSCSSLSSEDRKAPALEKPVPAPEALIYPDSVDHKSVASEDPKPAPEDPDDNLNRFATDRIEDIIAHAKKEEPVTNPEAEIIEDAQDMISPKDDDE